MSTEVNENNQHAGPQHTLSRSANVTIMMVAKTGESVRFEVWPHHISAPRKDFYMLYYSGASDYVIIDIRWDEKQINHRGRRFLGKSLVLSIAKQISQNNCL